MFKISFTIFLNNTLMDKFRNMLLVNIKKNRNK